MASSADVRDIMGLAPQDTTITKEHILGTEKKRSKRAAQPVFQKPEGMHRELYNLLYSENKELPCPLIPTDTSKDLGYKQMRAKLGMRRVRAWKWLPFTNPARKDGLVLYHWRRQADDGKEYPFAKFNKRIDVPTYTEAEYQNHLASPGWTREETDHLMDLAQRFDLRFIIMQDRWDSNTYSKRSVEDLKERYYYILDKLEKAQNPNQDSPTKKQFVYDADHERRRKEQLERLYSRTKDQVEEEEMLRVELRKIEARKKEREKKTADLQKLIAQADSSSGAGELRKLSKKARLNSLANRQRQEQAGGVVVDQNGIRWPDLKSSGVSLRSQRIKLPLTVGHKKTKAIECMLKELGVDTHPPPTEEIATEFNELRSEMVLLYELKNALTTCEFEMTSLKHQYEGLVPGKSLEIPDKLKVSTTSIVDGAAAIANTTEKKKSLADVIDVVGNTRDASSLNRKRKAALEQGNILKKIKKKIYQ